MEKLELKLNNKSLSDLTVREFAMLCNYKVDLIAKSKIHNDELLYMVKKSLFENPTAMFDCLYDKQECIWSKNAGLEQGTSFDKIRADSKHLNPELWKCAYDCDGFNYECGGYQYVGK